VHSGFVDDKRFACHYSGRRGR